MIVPPTVMVRPETVPVIEQATLVCVTHEAGESTEQSQPLGLSYPSDVFSLSHVALPFPPDDALYGMQPSTAEDFGIQLGTIAARGERGALIMSLDGLLRTSSNPFFSYMTDRIEEGITSTPPQTHQ